MSAPDLPPGLVEAVAEAISTQREEWFESQTRLTLDEFLARAAVAAMVEHLGLTEETRHLCSCGGNWPVQHCMADDHDALPPEFRLVTKWREVQP